MSPRAGVLVAALVLARLVGVPLASGDRPCDLGGLTTAPAPSVISAGGRLIFCPGGRRTRSTDPAP